MRCKLCGGDSTELLQRGVRQSRSVDVHACRDCGVAFLSDFSARTPSFYGSSQFVTSCELKGTTIEERLRHFAAENQRRYERYRSLMAGRSVLDFGCGAGAFLAHAAQVSLQAAGVEPSPDFRDHVQAAGLPCYSSIENVPPGERFDLIFSFHVFEHLSEPLEALQALRERLRPGGTVVIEVPNLDDVMVKLFRNEAYCNFIFSLDHLFYFTAGALEKLAERAGMRVVSTSYIQRYPIANHLHWLATGRPQGEKVWGACFGSEPLVEAYESSLAAIGMTDAVVVQLAC